MRKVRVSSSSTLFIVSLAERRARLSLRRRLIHSLAIVFKCLIQLLVIYFIVQLIAIQKELQSYSVIHVTVAATLIHVSTGRDRCRLPLYRIVPLHITNRRGFPLIFEY